jgi:hypothetical protein
MLNNQEISESQAEALIKKYRHKFTPAGQAILANWRQAQKVALLCEQPEPSSNIPK